MEVPSVSRSMAVWSYAKKSDSVDNGQPVSPAQSADRSLPDSAVGAMPPVQDKGQAEEDGAIFRKQEGAQECQTCKNRKYQDGSNDPGVSYKTPTQLSPEQASSAVRGHEMEHVTREQSKADRENREVVAQTVMLHTAVCPECGRPYISGGTTRTVTKGRQETPSPEKYQVGMPQEEAGKNLNADA